MAPTPDGSSTAEKIVEEVGGPDNILGLTHCATRLRFELKDASAVDQGALEKIPGVMGAVPQGGDVGPTHWNPQVRAWYSTASTFRRRAASRAARDLAPLGARRPRAAARRDRAVAEDARRVPGRARAPDEGL